MFDFLRKHNWRLKTRKNGKIEYKCTKCAERITVYSKKDLPKRGCRGSI